MKSINAFSKALLLCGCAVAAPGVLQAETVSQSAGVTIVRGADDAESAAQRQSSRGRDGVAVFRGESSNQYDNQANTRAPVSMAPTQVVGGQNLWLHDANTNTVTACSLWYDFYGNRTVRCGSE
jgi:hypothetical protein